MNADTPALLLRRPTHWLIRHAAMAVALVALADWLFYDAVFPGLSLAVFFAACGLVAMIANPLRARGLSRIAASAAFALALLAIVENLSALSFFVAASATLLFTIIMVSTGALVWSPATTARGFASFCRRLLACRRYHAGAKAVFAQTWRALAHRCARGLDSARSVYHCVRNALRLG